MKSLINYINENLNTYSSSDLQKKIKEYFPDYKFSFKLTLNNKKTIKNKYSNKSFVLFAEKNVIKKLKNDEFFNNLIHFYGYYITSSNIGWLCISPLYPENVNKFVYYNKGLYHLTTSNNDKSIQKNGLRCKNNKYRDFPKRLYLYSINDDNPKFKKEFIDKIINDFDLDEYGLSVYKIDINKLKKSNIDFYTDDYMEEKESVFTYHNIPKEYITKIQ